MATNINKSMKHENDELYTPKILVDVIKPFLIEWHDNFVALNNREPHIWCPFDRDESEFCFLLKELDYNFYNSHIDYGQDFFEKIKYYKPDLVLSNPPFSKKLEVFKALNERNIPWALCMNLEALNYQIIGEYFADNPIGLIIPDKKISFNGKTSSFNTSYYCSESFHKGITFIHCEHNNGGKYFVPSRMYNDN
ncbi:MAG: sugar-phosphate nucleotidyltransferase [Clostridia bacterium]|nr:sugar-phosphate nucleotidyltransferase [Clostridia bacterium]